LSAQYSFKVQSSLDELERVTSAIEEIGQQENWPPDLAFKVNLILDELGVNIMSYGGEVSGIEISLSSEEEAITIEITDDGEPFDPLNDAAEPDLTSPLGERRVGGLGLYLVRSMVDELHYRREQGKNHLVLMKRRS
jgi:anti-sigma regulatory factor (Ser/Thr protein kinase)